MTISLSDQPLWTVVNPHIKGRQTKAIVEQRAALVRECPELLTYFSQDNVIQLIDGINTHSPYLQKLIKDMPRFLANSLKNSVHDSFNLIISELNKSCTHAAHDVEIMFHLRQAKKQCALVIALADIGSVWRLSDVTSALSQFADCAVQNSINYLLRKAEREGKFKPSSHPLNPDLSGFVVLAMGKHGAKELNYSSDIDLIVLYDYQRAETYLNGDIAPFFVRLTQSMVRLLQERTPDGYVLRVDLRLRPDPGSTSVAISFNAARDYYEVLGQNWERAALIKARSIAGDISAGDNFLAALAPFIWRKYFDYGSIADIHAMKRQIHAVRGHEVIKVSGHDIKLGRGGIREIEFFVQTQQLIFAGRRTQLRGSQTLNMLAKLHEDGWITAKARDDLTKAYVELRTIEHRLQMVNDEQTQRLPNDDASLLSFAQFCGFKTSSAFSKHMLKILNIVEYHYARLFESAPMLDSQMGSLVFTGVTDDPETLDTLQKLGFKDAVRAIETIRGWHFGRHSALQSARAREVLTELVPPLLQSFSDSGDADEALRAFDAALANMPAAIELLSILKSNKKVRDIFSDILGGAPRLTEIISSRPHVLDAAIDPLYQDHLFDRDRYHERLSLILNNHLQLEDRLDAFRDLHHEESFLISFKILTESVTPQEGAVLFSTLASELINATLIAVKSEFEIEYGIIEDGEYAIIGMGKLGSEEMTANSDLDLISVYRFNELVQGSSGGHRSLHPNQYYTRLTQRVIRALTAATKRGVLYDVDMRLRPSGTQGPVASQYKSFVDYYHYNADFWEFMALTRAMLITGNSALCDQLKSDIQHFLTSQSNINNLSLQILDMRQLIEKEKSHNDLWDLKNASGGLVDIEFCAQYFALSYGHQYKNLLMRHPRKILEQAYSSHLISKDDVDILIHGYDMLSALQQAINLALRDQFEPEKCASSVLKHISSLLHFPDFKSLEQGLSEQKKLNRSVFYKIIKS